MTRRNKIALTALITLAPTMAVCFFFSQRIDQFIALVALVECALLLIIFFISHAIARHRFLKELDPNKEGSIMQKYNEMLAREKAENENTE